jgi:hypothetical protein
MPITWLTITAYSGMPHLIKTSAQQAQSGLSQEMPRKWSETAAYLSMSIMHYVSD